MTGIDDANGRDSHDRPRRSTHVEHEVVYAAVGASSAPDLMRFPPHGAHPYESELKLGSGQHRFIIASSMLMTWGAHRGAGITVTDLTPGHGEQYVGIEFDADCNAKPPVIGDVQYSPDGEPFLTSGTVAVVSGPDQQDARKIRVVYTIGEERRAGFAWGSADELGAIGEQCLRVEHRDDDTVWAVVRGFVWPAADGWFGLKGRSATKAVSAEAQRLLASLLPGAAARGTERDSHGDPGDEGSAPEER